MPKATSDIKPSLIWLEPAPPARRSLSRGAIVAAAIRVADRVGAKGLTMSAVADELGSYTAMALYRYVGSKEGLVDLMLDEVVAEVPLPDAGSHSPSDAWLAALRHLELESWEMVERHLWYAQLVHTRPPLGPNTMRRTEAALRLLTSAGLELAEALSYFALLDRHVFSSAVLAAEERSTMAAHGIKDAAELMTAIRDLTRSVTAGGAYPLLAKWMSAPHGPTSEEQMIIGLDFLLEGIARRIENGHHAR